MNAGCQQCATSLASCASSSCQAQCGGGGGGQQDAGTGYGGGQQDASYGYGGGQQDSGTGGGGNCATLAGCCSALPAQYQASCQAVASYGQDASCQETLAAFQAQGYCY
jgi:hypothetical protein